MEETQKRRQKGRGETEIPTCIYCDADMLRSYENATSKAGNPYRRAFGWHCNNCEYEQWDKKKDP